MSMNLMVPGATVPVELAAALGKWSGRYAEAKAIYSLVWLDGNCAVGVFGDGSMGCYEWFVWAAGSLATSDVGYGNPAGPLRDVLNQEYQA